MSHMATNIVDASRPMYTVHFYNCIPTYMLFLPNVFKSGSTAYYDNDNETLNKYVFVKLQIK